MILAIETATDICSVALIEDNAPIASQSVNEKNVHSEKLLNLIDTMTATANVPLSGLDAVAVSIGPGSFTGLRIGLSTAKGLALALDVPIIPVPTLDGIAEEYRRMRTVTSDELFCATIDAKRDEAFYAFYTISEKTIQLVSEYRIKLKSEIAQEAKRENAVIDRPVCNAVAIGIIAEKEKTQTAVKDFSLLEPLYLREFAATTPKK